MKKKMYIVCFFALAAFFTTIYYASYSYSLKNNTSDNIITKYNSENTGTQDENQNIRAVNASDEPVVLSSAVCTIQDYNLTTDYLTEREYTIPLELVGKSRTEVIEYIENYMSNLSDEEKAVTNYELISFSNDEIVIRKSYKTENDVNYSYWVQLIAGKVIVYKADKSTIYIKTDIESDDLSEEEQGILKEGKYITGVQELFNYLESCTS